MSAREPYYQIVRTDAEQPYLVRFFKNGREIFRSSENYTRRQGAKRAIEINAQAFSLTPVHWTYRRDVLYIYVQGVGCAVHEVDER